MGRVKRAVGKVVRGEEGQGLVEYGLILSLVVLVAVVALAFFGTRVHDINQHNVNVIQNSPANQG